MAPDDIPTAPDQSRAAKRVGARRSVGPESEVRGGPEAPDISINEAEEWRIREIAFQLWHAAGEPQGRDLEFWESARIKLQAGDQ